MKRRQLSPGILTGLYHVYKYRFLTISQFARIANLTTHHVAEVLRDLEKGGLIGFFGYTSIPGQGKTPKVYFLRRKGWELLQSEVDDWEISGAFMEVHTETTWTPQMYHRLRIIDCLVALEIALRTRPHLQMVKVFVEYRMVKRGGVMVRETTDFVADEQMSANKLVPDAVYILENSETQKRAIFFVEADMGTEQLTSRIPRDARSTIHYKLTQYDRYLKSGRYRRTYGEYGEFRFFTMLFVTTTEARVENIRQEVYNLPADLGTYYRFTTYEKAVRDFLGQIWKSRAKSDTTVYSLVR
jgi:hypothetical protein